MTRFFGAYSCRSRGAVKEEASDSITVLPELEDRPSASWARCIRLRSTFKACRTKQEATAGQVKKVFELDPLKCPKSALRPADYGGTET